MDRLIVSPSPHIYKGESTAKIMWLVVLSLIPAGIAGVVIFGFPALQVILTSVISAVLCEAVIQFITKRKVSVFDGSVFLTGLLLAYNLPSNMPLWVVACGSVFAIIIGKQVFGGLGQNIFNPALVGRVFLMASWPRYMTNFIAPFSVDAVTKATPLEVFKEKGIVESVSYWNLFIGARGGCIGEVCIAALIIGAIFLLIRGYISWHIPFSYVVSTAILMFIFGTKGLFTGDWLFHILNGGLILGAFFMATDYVTSPLTRQGQVIFGVGCGVITAVIRLWGGYPEGASYAILMMNAATPIIDRFTRNRIYGS